MELELCLALPTNPTKGFDLNSCAFEIKEAKISGKRGFNEAFKDPKPMIITEILPLLLWNDKPNDGDDRMTPKKSSCAINQIDEEGNGIVGWPPIKSWRKKLQNHQQYQMGPQREENGYGGTTGTQSMYVKVKMEGEAIGRKVDLGLHSSYETLESTLVDMFGKCQIKVNGSRDGAAYTFTYQDKEGDWLLVGDVPWKTFIQSVQRLKIQRNGKINLFSDY